MLTSSCLLRLSAAGVLFFLSIGCSGKDISPVLPPPPQKIPSDQQLIDRENMLAPNEGNYIEKTGPNELLNPDLKLPYTMNTRPTFEGILHTKETVQIRQVAASVNDKFCDNVKLDENNISFTPDFDLEYGYNAIYISVVFENSHVACAWWRFEVLKEPPSITGFLGDLKERIYYVCFSREIEKDRLADVSNWSLNGDSSLIEKVEPWHDSDWAIVYLASEEEKADLQDQDYYICFDTGNGITEKLLIPQKSASLESGGDKGAGCGRINHFPPQDVHYSFESEFHAMTYEVILNPGCVLNAEWTQDSEYNYTISDSRYTILSEEKSSVLDYDVQSVYHRFPLSSGHHTLMYSPDVGSKIGVNVWDNRNPPNLVWQFSGNFPADLEPPVFTLQPVFMTGTEAADFLEVHYWEKKQTQGTELPWYIRNMMGLLRSDYYKCRKLVLWGAEDRKAPGVSHLGYMWEYGYLDWGWDENSPPGIEHEWIQNDMDTLGAFVVDLPPEAPGERIPWNDHQYNPLHVDGRPDGEYKVWVFDYETFINATLDDVSEHHDTFIMRPMVMDNNGNWRRADNIYVNIFANPNNFQLNFISPTGGNRKQYINLTPGEDLPEPIPDDNRGERVEVKVEITTPQNIVIPQGSYICFSWDDPAIDGTPFTTTNPPGHDSPTPFPWVRMTTDDRQACTDDPNKLISNCYPDQNPEENCRLPYPTGRINDPTTYPPHIDNSFPEQYGEEGFPSSLNVYCKTYHYHEPGYDVGRDSYQYVLIEPYNSENCLTTVETTFYTSNFGGDNYILQALICIPIWDSEHAEWGWVYYPWISSNAIINVWRKMWVEFAFMEEAEREPGTTGKYIASWQDPNDDPITYTHINGPFTAYCLGYIRNAFDDCFIEISQGFGMDVDTNWEDELEHDDLVPYAHNNTSFHVRRTPHCFQLLYVDHLTLPEPPKPEDWLHLERGATPAPNENHHSFGASGSIRDVYNEQVDYFYIDKNQTRDYYEIISNTSAHELGHALGLGFGGIICDGHVSGPGLMWAAHKFCDAPLTKSQRMSFFWGDHVFLFRAIPAI